MFVENLEEADLEYGLPVYSFPSRLTKTRQKSLKTLRYYIIVPNVLISLLGDSLFSSWKTTDSLMMGKLCSSG